MSHHDNHDDDGDGQYEVGMIGHGVLELGVATVQIAVVLSGALLAVRVVLLLAAAGGHVVAVVVEVRVFAVFPFGVGVHAAAGVL